MSRVTTYLNFDGNTEEAFALYAAAFGTEPTGPISRFGDMPTGPGSPELTEVERSRVLHAELPILAGHVLMATDLLGSLGQELRIGNNTTINLELDSVEEAERLYAVLSEAGSDATGLQPTPWAERWGTCLDRFGIRWMFNVPLGSG